MSKDPKLNHWLKYSWTWNTDLWHSLPWLIFFLDYWRNLNCFNCFWDCLLYFCLHPTLSVLTFFSLVSFSKWWAITENGFWPKSFFHDRLQRYVTEFVIIKTTTPTPYNSLPHNLNSFSCLYFASMCDCANFVIGCICQELGIWIIRHIYSHILITISKSLFSCIANVIVHKWHSVSIWVDWPWKWKTNCTC